MPYNSQYPCTELLREKSAKRIPKFAFEYLDGGCNEDVNLRRNTQEIRDVQLVPRYLRDKANCDMRTELFGHTYDAPFGIAPIGLQGLMWPKAAEILATAAKAYNIPFILSTVTTSSIERIAEITEGDAWFQLYHPTKTEVRDDIIDRVANAGMPVLVLLSDVPTFGYRPRDIRNGLAMPPKMSMANMLQVCMRPRWALNTLLSGQPTFKTLEPYMPKGLNLKQLGKFMDETFSGRLNAERIKPIRDKWKGKLVLKGVACEEDIEKAISLGVDGLIISNHGGRQLDAGQSTIEVISEFADKYKDKITITMDSGIRSGPDIARSLACGAQFVFLGRAFMYSVAALGKQGGEHATSMLKTQLMQVMEQLCCEHTSDLHQHLIDKRRR